MVAVGDDLLSMVVVIPNLMLALTYSANFFPIFKGNCLITKEWKMWMIKKWQKLH